MYGNTTIVKKYQARMTPEGMLGTGKSYLCRRIIESIDGRALIINYAGMPKSWRDVPIIHAANPTDWQWDSGLSQVIAANYDHETKDTKNYIFEYIYRYYKGGIVVFDDCREHITDKITHHPYLKKLLSSFRHKELDLFFVMHSPGDVPKQVWMYNTTTFVGHTDATISRSDIRIGSVERIIAAQAKVRPEFLGRKRHGDGSHIALFVRVEE